MLALLTDCLRKSYFFASSTEHFHANLAIRVSPSLDIIMGHTFGKPVKQRTSPRLPTSDSTETTPATDQTAAGSTGDETAAASNPSLPEDLPENSEQSRDRRRERKKEISCEQA